MTIPEALIKPVPLAVVPTPTLPDAVNCGFVVYPEPPLAIDTTPIDPIVVMPAVAAAPAAGPTAGVAEPEAEQDEFEVVLASIGDKKIQVIKVIREITSLGLKEAKDLVDGAPSTVREGVTKEEAEQIKAKLEEKGASVEFK